jgi:hypothetical protein
MAGWHGFGRRRWWAVVSMVLALTTTVFSPAAADESGPDSGVVFPGGEPEAATEAAPATPRRPVDPSESPVLEEPAAGREALDQVDDRLGEVAARNGMSAAELEHLLLSDDTVYLDRYGYVFFVDPAPATAPRSDGEAAPAAPFPYEDTFLLSSKPGSKRVVYLDFNGHTLPADNGWQSGGYAALAYDTNGAPATFSNAERDVIQSIWQRVAEDFAPFDVNVTTQAPAFDMINRSSGSDLTYGTRVLITNTAATDICGSCGGVAYLGVFDIYEFPHAFFQPAWCFPGWLGGDTKAMAECVSHEVGHTMGLEHDGREFFGDYYEGHEPWAPIMGVSYYEPVSQWSKGEYDGATNTEDDFAVMSTHGVKQRIDDHTNGDTTATVLLTSRTGVVASKDDYDLFSFTASESGPVTFVAEPSSVSPNLDVVLKLYSADMDLLATDEPPVVKVWEDEATGMDASLTHDVAQGVTYYLQVHGGAHLTPTTGYSRYGSIGAYELVAEGITGLSSCGGLVVTLQGTTGADTITGTSGIDVIDGLGGDDTIDGLGGADVICGGDGNDTLDGGDGADDLFGGNGANDLVGGTGDDSLTGGSGIDSILGEAGNDSLSGAGSGDDLVGGDGNDTLTGGDGADTLGGDAGADVINGNSGADEIEGTTGNDIINGGTEGDVVDGGSGIDYINGGTGNDTVSGGISADMLLGGGGTDTVNGNGGNDDMFGNAGSDTLNGGNGSDSLNGGSGTDTCRGNAGSDGATACEVKSSIP